MRTYPNVEKLQDGGTYQIRTYRLPLSSREDAAFVAPPFKAGRLFIMRDPKGNVCLVTTKDDDWAEADPRSGDYYEEAGIGKFIVEDYALEIKLDSITQ